MKIKELVTDLNKTKSKFYIAGAGGGQSFITQYTSVPRSSESFLGCTLPYSKENMQEFLGEEPKKYVSKETALKLAVKSYEIALKSGHPDKLLFGIGFTSSITTDNEREGRENQMFVALHNNLRTTLSHLTLSFKDRAWQEKEFSQNIFSILEQRFETERISKKGYSFELTRETRDIISSTHKITVKELDRLFIFSGSFNPLHDGHIRIYKEVADEFECQPIFELSRFNTDKPALDFITLNERLNQFYNRGLQVIATECPLFTNKIRFFFSSFIPKSQVYIIGYDTWNRILRDYNKQEYLFSLCRSYNVKFLVVGRDGKKINPDLCFDDYKEIVIANERINNLDINISSTQIRQQQTIEKEEKCVNPKVKEISEFIKKNIKYKDWNFYIKEDEKDFYLQIQFDAPDNFSGKIEKQYCRKWRLSTFMSETEIVRTVFLAVVQAERHETEENFLYKGHTVFNSHININKITEILEKDSPFDYRK